MCIERIENYAFRGCTPLHSVHLAGGGVETRTLIGFGAFQDCTSLQSVRIGNAGYSLCNSLRSVHLPNSVTIIEMYAFQGCKSLISVQIPESVGIIECRAFTDCKSLQSVWCIPGGAAIQGGPFHGCDKFEQRQTNGTNYDLDTETWLRRRFDHLPIHRACYYTMHSQQQHQIICPPSSEIVNRRHWLQLMRWA